MEHLKNGLNGQRYLNPLDSKLKLNGFMEDNQIKVLPEVHNSKKNICEDEENGQKPLQIKTKFVEDNLHDDLLSENKIKSNISQKVLKKKKADYIYDFVKIRVHLDNHFYILSRFFISRMLTLCKVIFKLQRRKTIIFSFK